MNRSEHNELWDYQDTDSFKSAARLHDWDLSNLLEPCATQGDADSELQNRIIDVHRMMRVAYKANIRQVGLNIYPLIVARDTAPNMSPSDLGRQGIGGVYTLYLENGETYSVQPTPRAYELLKCLSHMPLGLYSILSPYFLNPTARAWEVPLKAFREKVVLAIEASQNAENALTSEQKQWAEDMLLLTQTYIDTVLEQHVSVDEFQSYTAELTPYLRECMDAAAQLQVRSVTDALLAWREMLGAEQWKKLYVMIPTIWPVAENSPRWQIFRSLMEPENIDTHLLTGEGVRNDEEARELVGRIVADRLAARLILGTGDERSKRMNQCISSRTDVVSDSAYQALKEMTQGCPVHSLKE